MILLCALHDIRHLHWGFEMWHIYIFSPKMAVASHGLHVSEYFLSFRTQSIKLVIIYYRLRV